MLASLTLVACTEGGQQRSAIPDWSQDLPRSRSLDEGAYAHAGNSSAVMFAPGAEQNGSFYAYERDLAPEYARRDGALAISEPDATAGWYAWPEQARASLDDQGRFYTSSNPNVFVFPGGHNQYTRPYAPYNRTRGHRDAGRAHGEYGQRGNIAPRRRVR